MVLNVPTVDYLSSIDYVLNHPIYTFIGLAAKKCGYSETTHCLLVDWVHPMFMKENSAASKQENTNMWEAKSGTFAYE